MYDLEPWAEERADFAAGTAIMHNAAAHGGKPRPPVEYMPFLKKEKPKPQRQSDMKAAWQAICDRMAAADKKQNPEP